MAAGHVTALPQKKFKRLIFFDWTHLSQVYYVFTAYWATWAHLSAPGPSIIVCVTLNSGKWPIRLTNDQYCVDTQKYLSIQTHVWKGARIVWIFEVLTECAQGVVNSRFRIYSYRTSASFPGEDLESAADKSQPNIVHVLMHWQYTLHIMSFVSFKSDLCITVAITVLHRRRKK